MHVNLFRGISFLSNMEFERVILDSGNGIFQTFNAKQELNPDKVKRSMETAV